MKPDESRRKDYESLLSAHSAYVAQMTQDLENWQDMCTKLMTLFKIYSSLEHNTLEDGVTTIAPVLEQITQKLAESSDYQALTKKHNQLLDIAKKQKAKIDQLMGSK